MRLALLTDDAVTSGVVDVFFCHGRATGRVRAVGYEGGVSVYCPVVGAVKQDSSESRTGTVISLNRHVENLLVEVRSIGGRPGPTPEAHVWTAY